MASWKGRSYDYSRHGHLAPDCHLGGGMAHLYRLILWAFMAWASLGAPGLSYAVTPLSDREYKCSAPSMTWQPSYSAACNEWRSYIEGEQPTHEFRWSDGFPTSVQCRLDKRPVGSTGAWSLNNQSCALATRSALICPGNSAPNGAGGCSCNEGYSENSSGDSCLPIPPPSCPPETTRINGICVPDKECPDGYVRVNGVCQKPPKCRPGPAGDWTTTSSAAEITCFGGCVISLAPSDIGVPLPEGGVLWTHAGTYTGGECSGTGSGGPGDGPGSGDPGEGPGSGDPGEGPGAGDPGDGTGASPTPPKPVPPGSPSPPPPQPQPPNEDGTCPPGTFKSGSSCIKNPEPPNGDGVCPPGTSKVNGTCVYSVPSPGDGGGGGGSPPGGGGPGTGTGEGSSFGGNCAAGFACTGGDAIQCAIAKEQYVRNCKLFDDKSSPEAQRYLTAVTAPPSNATDGLPGNETVNLGPSRFDQTDSLGVGGSGMSDLTVVVMGSSISLPFSRINPYLAMFGNVLVAVSLILAARIVARG